MYIFITNGVRIGLIIVIFFNILCQYTHGITSKKGLCYINRINLNTYNRINRIKSESNDKDSNPNLYVENFINSPENQNLFKHQVFSYIEKPSENSKLRNSDSWSQIVYDEILKNKSLERNPDPFPRDLTSVSNNSDGPIRETRPYNYRLTPEGRLKIEDRIENLKRAAHSNPVKYKEETPILWIIRSSHGNYCSLLEKDDDKIKSLVNRVRKQYSPTDLQILVMKADIKMPLCEIVMEGTMPDLARIMYARGGTLQYYVHPRFWSKCELIEMDPRLEVKYGRASSPGLFPVWDEDGMIEEINDCMDVKPDYALEFIIPNVWQLIPMVFDRNRRIMELYYEKIHWPTRLKVQRAFEYGIEDYRHVIEKEYEKLQKLSRSEEGVLDTWLSHPDKFD